MDPQSKKLLQDTFELAQDNNKILHGIRRSQRIASFMSLLYWVIIIGIALGSFYYLQPYTEQVQKFWRDTGMTIDKVKSMIPKQ